jgi:hypothetical protein
MRVWAKFFIEREIKMAVCKEEGCSKDAHTKGICITHYQRERRAGLKAKVDGATKGIN